MLKEQYDEAKLSVRQKIEKWASGEDGLYAFLGDPKSKRTPAIAPTEEIK